MKKIKSLLFVLLGLLVFASCSDDETPTVSFEKNSYILMPEQDLEVVVKLSDSPTADLEIPFVLNGSAEKDVDYTVSTEKIVVKAGEINAKLVISPNKNYETDRSIIINLGTVVGYDFGDNQIATISITPKEKLIYTFVEEYSVLENSLDVYINIFDSKGDRVTISKDIHIPFEINEAVQGAAKKGVHYNVKGDVTEFVIPAGSSEGKITLEYIENTEVEKNRVAISIPELGVGFIKGGYTSTTVKVYGSTLGKLFGKWVGKKLANKEFLISDAKNWGFPLDSDNLPENITNDTLLIQAGDKDMIKTIMTGDAGHYFRESEITYVETKKFVYGEEYVIGAPVPEYELAVFTLAKANVNFSANNEEIKDVKVGFRVTEKEGEEILEISIYDFAPTDFYANIYNMVKEWGEEYPMNYDPIRYQFKRVK